MLLIKTYFNEEVKLKRKIAQHMLKYLICCVYRIYIYRKEFIHIYMRL